MRENIKKAWNWYRIFSTIVGLPVAFVFLALFFQKIFFTFTCHTASFRCEYAFAATQAQIDFVGELLSANPGRDIISVPQAPTPTKKR